MKRPSRIWIKKCVSLKSREKRSLGVIKIVVGYGDNGESMGYEIMMFPGYRVVCVICECFLDEIEEGTVV